MRVVIQPVGDVDLEFIQTLVGELKARIPVEVNIIPVLWSLTPPIEAFDFDRMQYDALHVARWLGALYEGFRSPGKLLVLGILGGDGYVDGYNFVFGLALREESVAVVFTKRLAGGSRELFIERLLKESLHEIGHLLGLDHCDDKACVMSFSNSLLEVDMKHASYCGKCRLKLVS